MCIACRPWPNCIGVLHAAGECRALQAEYDQLRRALGDEAEARCEDSAAGAQTNGDVDVAADARLLRQHKGRLETKMRILEEHNEQLDSQLRRLRQLLHDSQQVSARPSPRPSLHLNPARRL